ncbi:hypothetical protein RUM43_000114 [Polyplax serrata]|uniref:Uncharacterized protein n=1 Tax=Polyplax serrata TaxID=468196 RepID=A0AAN8SDH7_POLSC
MNNNKTVKKKKKKFIFRSCGSPKNSLSTKSPMDNFQRIENLKDEGKGQSEKKNTLKSLEHTGRSLPPDFACFQGLCRLWEVEVCEAEALKCVMENASYGKRKKLKISLDEEEVKFVLSGETQKN